MRKGPASGAGSVVSKYGIFLSLDKLQAVEHYFLEKVRLECVPSSAGTISYEPDPKGLCWKKLLKFREGRSGFKIPNATVTTSSDQKHCLLVSGSRVFVCRLTEDSSDEIECRRLDVAEGPKTRIIAKWVEKATPSTVIILNHDTVMVWSDPFVNAASKPWSQSVSLLQDEVADFDYSFNERSCCLSSYHLYFATKKGRIFSWFPFFPPTVNLSAEATKQFVDKLLEVYGDATGLNNSKENVASLLSRFEGQNRARNVPGRYHLDFEEEVVAASNFRSDEAVALKVISHCEMQLFCVFFRSGYIKLYLMLDACLPLYKTEESPKELIFVHMGYFNFDNTDRLDRSFAIQSWKSVLTFPESKQHFYVVSEVANFRVNFACVLERLASDIEKAQSIEELDAFIKSCFKAPAEFYQPCLQLKYPTVKILDTSSVVQLMKPTHPCNTLLAFKRQVDEKPAKETFSAVAFSLDAEVSEISSKISQFPTFEKFSELDNKQKKGEMDRFVQIAKSLSDLLMKKIDELVEKFQEKHREVFSDFAALKNNLLYYRQRQASIQERLRAFTEKTARLSSRLRPLLATEEQVLESIKRNKDQSDLAAVQSAYQQFSLKQANILSTVSKMGDQCEAIHQLLHKAQLRLPFGVLQKLEG